jgi:hypothetical protein
VNLKMPCIRKVKLQHRGQLSNVHPVSRPGEHAHPFDAFALITADEIIADWSRALLINGAGWRYSSGFVAGTVHLERRVMLASLYSVERCELKEAPVIVTGCSACYPAIAIGAPSKHKAAHAVILLGLR